MAVNNTKGGAKPLLVILWIQIVLVKEGGLEKLRNADRKPLADFVNDPQLHGIVGAVDDVVDGGFGDTAAGEQLILGHFLFLKKLLEPFADCLIQLHRSHHPFFCCYGFYYMKN